MKRAPKRSDFAFELRRRLRENRKLYLEHSPFEIFDTPFGKFVASQLGVNPWKVLLPASFGVAILLRILLGGQFSEMILRILGG